MPPLKGLACVSLLTLAIAAPSAFAQTSVPAPSGSPMTSPGNPAATSTDQQSGHKHRKHRSKSSTQAQPGAAPGTQN